MKKDKKIEGKVREGRGGGGMSNGDRGCWKARNVRQNRLKKKIK